MQHLKTNIRRQLFLLRDGVVFILKFYLLRCTVNPKNKWRLYKVIYESLQDNLLFLTRGFVETSTGYKIYSTISK